MKVASADSWLGVGMTGKGSTMPEVPYDLASTEDWAAEVRRTFSFRPIGDAWDYIGACPRCEHQIVKRLETAGATGFRPEDITTMGIVVRCNCGSDHAGRPNGSKGCGAYGTLELVWS
jgi:hypothetical protein